MATNWEPVQIVCDAPSYAIVQACSTIGIERPEDVRWWEVGHFLEQHGYRPLPPDGRWKALGERSTVGLLVCPCGRELPRLVEYRFYFDDDTAADYLLGQCRRCKTIYWHGPKDVYEGVGEE